MSDEEKTICPPYEVFYIYSMLFNAESAIRSVQAINSIFHVVEENSPEDPIAALPVRRLLGELQNLVIQTAALSRYFWPVRSAHGWRGAQLRKRLGMTDDSPLRSRSLRNAIEHFDEQLDLYLEQGIVGRVLPEYVGPFEEQREPRIHLFRAYYVDTGVFELLGERYQVEPLVKEIGRVYEQLKEMDSSGGHLLQGDTRAELE